MDTQNAERKFKRTSISEILTGFLAILKELFSIRNNQEYFRMGKNILLQVLVLGIIGVLRTVLETVFGIKFMFDPNEKWYSLAPDVLFVMFSFPVYLCFSGALLIHIFYRLFGLKLSYPKLVSFAFYLQVLHLIVPFFDFVAHRYQIRHLFMLPDYLVFKYSVTGIPVSLGIIVVWIVTMYLMIKMFVRRSGNNTALSLLALLFSYLLLIIPIYYIFPLFNVAFNALARNGMGFYDVFWGYGLFFYVASFLSILYFMYHRKNDRKVSGA
jgi:hypothetical protein